MVSKESSAIGRRDNARDRQRRRLTKEKYLALVAARFKAADPDSDGKLDAKELATPAGKDLVRLCMSEIGRRRNFAGGRRWR